MISKVICNTQITALRTTKAGLFFYFIICTGNIFAQKPDPDTFQSPGLFLPGIVSTGMNERDLTISPDGNEIYFTVTTPNQSFSSIFYVEKMGDEWTKPRLASFSGTYPDMEPMFSPDGNTMYFASKRPDSTQNPVNADIFLTRRSRNGWSQPERLPFCTPADEYYPSVNTSGDVFFTGVYDMENTGEDIYVSRKKGKDYLPPVRLQDSVNSVFHEFNAFIQPQEKYIIFTRYGQKGDKGGGDLYVSFHENGQWSRAMPMEAANSVSLDYCPFVDAAGEYLYFTSRRSLIFEPDTANEDLYAAYQKLFQFPGNSQGDIYKVKLPFSLPDGDKN